MHTRAGPPAASIREFGVASAVWGRGFRVRFDGPICRRTASARLGISSGILLKCALSRLSAARQEGCRPSEKVWVTVALVSRVCSREGGEAAQRRCSSAPRAASAAGGGGGRPSARLHVVVRHAAAARAAQDAVVHQDLPPAHAAGDRLYARSSARPTTGRPTARPSARRTRTRRTGSSRSGSPRSSSRARRRRSSRSSSSS